MGMGPTPPAAEKHFPLHAYVPPIHPEDLGDPLFKETHSLKYAYVAGAMANGITSAEMVAEAGKAGMIGFFGAAGLSLERIEAAISELQAQPGGLPYGFNLIHSPYDPAHEAATVDLYLRRGVRLVSASAYLTLTAPLVYYRVRGIHRDDQGNIVCPNRVVAKVSRAEVAEKFFSPAPEKLLRELVAQGKITETEAELAGSVPVAEDLTAEADSGGHTDNRPALALFPTMTALRDRMMAKYQYARPICVGLGGGVATPESAAAAFAMGAAYVVTGSVNQSCTEAGTSETVRKMLAEARQADVVMAPAADMFEMGVKVQVLKRGTMFAMRGAKLYELYKQYDAYEDIPQAQRAMVERDYLKCGFEVAWQATRSFFEQRDPQQNVRAEKDPKHRMALVFRSYLGQSSRWAITGDPGRAIDYQIWCGPAMGAFNEWVRGTFLEKPENRKTVTVAMNLLMGAAVVTRANWLRNQGVSLPAGAGQYAPMTLPEIGNLLAQ
ncbi:2-nitropropane dioxygenase [Desulfonema ishimotonii]|uniref:2-nitropropane dioxygenase n=2 Tax=Desulfonema ishimotonii TaxID=45657 RepID=A0A401FUV8_9BACT|nr:2-nitropropane dioxygenase [Desulfonema ishimotonii]